VVVLLFGSLSLLCWITCDNQTNIRS
jgi:hypothetical protein